MIKTLITMIANKFKKQIGVVETQQEFVQIMEDGLNHNAFPRYSSMLKEFDRNCEFISGKSPIKLTSQHKNELYQRNLYLYSQLTRAG